MWLRPLPESRTWAPAGAEAAIHPALSGTSGRPEAWRRFLYAPRCFWTRGPQEWRIPSPAAGSTYTDLDGLRGHAQRAKEIGYVGMHLIHPYHVPVVNDVFTPSADEIAEWQGLVQAMEEQRAQGFAAVTYKGNMVDIAHEQTARAMLDLARALGLVS